MLFIVTVKLPKNANHNPRKKMTAGCPVSPTGICTDVTGEHHSLLVEADDYADAHTVATGHGFNHITRVEVAAKPLS